MKGIPLSPIASILGILTLSSAFLTLPLSAQSPPQPQPSLPECPPPDPESERFWVSQVQVLGSTVLEAEIERMAAPFQNREVTFEELLCLRAAITQLYLDRGYLTSGAFLPNDQDITAGVVQVQVVEGELERIDISGLERLQEGYVRSRLQRAAGRPLNQQQLQEGLELLQLDPLLEQVNAELTPGSSPGRSVLSANLKEAPAFHASLGADNYRPSSIGSEQAGVAIAHDNLLGLGDRFSFTYNLSQGLNLFDASYRIPVNAREGSVSLRYWNADNRIIENLFQEFDIRNENETLSLSFRQPVERTPAREWALGLSLDLRRSRSYLLDEPFCFSLVCEGGSTNLTVLRFFQDWLDRGPDRVLAARSQFSFGLNLFEATTFPIGPDGQFFSWLGQFQWVQQLWPGVLLVARLDAQATPDSLPIIEQFSLGGIDTVRGYPQNQLVTDNGVLGSLELRLPLTEAVETLQLVPFVEIGTGWNNQFPDPNPSTLAGLGLGIRWAIGFGVTARLDYGIPLIATNTPRNSLQEQGFYFSLQYQPF